MVAQPRVTAVACSALPFRRMKTRPIEGPTIRAALLIGFGLTLGLWFFAGYQVTRRMTDAQQEAARVNARYVQAQELLSGVRAQVLLESVQVRDALLDPGPYIAGAYEHQAEEAHRAIEAALAQYVPVLDTAAERAQLGRLRREIDKLHTASIQVLSADRSALTTDAWAHLRRFMPQREAALRVSEEIQAINRTAFIEQQTTLGTVHSELQRQVWKVLGGALAVSLAIGWFAARHGQKLEGRLRQQRVREQQIAADLQKLSARLVHVQEEEQRRIARELHDEVGQALGAVKVELAVARRKIERLTGADDLLVDAQVSTESALRSVRDLSHLLHPSVLDDLGLAAALGSLTSDFSKRHDIQMDFDYDGIEDRPSPEAERAVYRIVQEALSNIARHARASAGCVAVQVLPGSIRVVIEDNGVGFDPAEAERPGRRRGLGLLGIRERVSQLAGTVRIGSSPGGTRIDVELPQVRPPVVFDGAATHTRSEPELAFVDPEAQRG